MADLDNKAPRFLDGDGDVTTTVERIVAEDTDSNMPIGIEGEPATPVGATDPAPAGSEAPNDLGDVLTYTLGGADAASFGIREGTGQLQTKAALDYETKQSYTVTVTATDPGGLSATVTVTIEVTDVNEPPVIMVGGLAVTGLASSDYDENGTDPVATYTASGPDAASVRWSLGGPDAGDFTITGGVLAFRVSPNYEAPADVGGDNVYNVTVTANDGENTAMRDVTVRVTDIDEVVVEGPYAYDANGNGTIDRPEVIEAIKDYLFERTGITRNEVIEVIRLYLRG